MKVKALLGAVALASVGLAQTASAASVSIGLTKLTGTTGGSPAQTAVYRSDLGSSGISSIESITINDNSSMLGGAAGQFSGFDLDAIILSTTFCADAACVAGLTGMSVFDYSTSGTIFTPGTQRSPTDPKLFGTDVTGTEVDNAVATLGSFDANSTTSVPPATGFVSMGDNGVLSFNLTSELMTSGLYLYLGEVGDNGEAIAGTIEISDDPTPTQVSEPETIALLGLGLLGVVGIRRQALKAKA